MERGPRTYDSLSRKGRKKDGKGKGRRQRGRNDNPTQALKTYPTSTVRKRGASPFIGTAGESPCPDPPSLLPLSSPLTPSLLPPVLARTSLNPKQLSTHRVKEQYSCLKSRSSLHDRRKRTWCPGIPHRFVAPMGGHHHCTRGGTRCILW